MQFGNMAAHQRKLLKNYFVLGFIPFGGDFNEFMLPFIFEMKEFEQRKLMKVNGQDAWVIARLVHQMRVGNPSRRSGSGRLSIRLAQHAP